jgi:hypothetical protein
MQTFCERHLMECSLEDINSVPLSSQVFLQKLGLPSLHPFCNESSRALLYPAAPDMGPAIVALDENLVEFLITTWHYYIPPATSLFLIWLFFFSAFIAPFGFILCCLFGKQGNLLGRVPLLPVVTLVSSWVILTDDNYVMEFGRLYGMALLIATLIVLRPRHEHILLILTVLVFCSFISPWGAEDPVTPQIEPGLYFNSHNALIDNLVSLWKENGLPDYSKVATPWQWTGDARTGLPYCMNRIKYDINFHRVWLATEDDEFVALDIAFPEEGHDWQEPLYLVFHGLNGGSNEGYVVDFARARLEQGSTVVVLIARGLADTPIQGFTVRTFYGACSQTHMLSYLPLLTFQLPFFVPYGRSFTELEQSTRIQQPLSSGTGYKLQIKLSQVLDIA